MTTWANFWGDPLAVLTLAAVISGPLIAIGIETTRWVQEKNKVKLTSNRKTEIACMRLFPTMIDIHARFIAIYLDLETKFAVIETDRNLELTGHYFSDINVDSIHEVAKNAEQLEDGVAHNIAQLSGLLWMYQDVVRRLMDAVEDERRRNLEPHFNQVREVLRILKPQIDETFGIVQTWSEKGIKSGNSELYKLQKTAETIRTKVSIGTK